MKGQGPARLYNDDGTFKTGVPIPVRHKPHLFRVGGQWRAWVSPGMSFEQILAARDHLMRLDAAVDLTRAVWCESPTTHNHGIKS